MKSFFSFLSHLFKKKSSHEKALETLKSITGFYNDIKSIILRIENPEILEFPVNTIIFKEGDNPDNVYLILEGAVKLVFPKTVNNSELQLILHKGEFFGELGVLANKPRFATAVAQPNLRLMVIDGNSFKKYFAEYPQLQQIVSKQQIIYKIPMKGLVEQYFGEIAGLGPTITNIYKMDKSRSIISSKALNQDVFMMSTVKLVPLIENHYRYQCDKSKVELRVHDHRLTTIKASGTWNYLPAACQLMLDNENIEESTLKNFELSGEIKAAQFAEDIICPCFHVKKSELQKFINDGVKSLDALSKETGAGTACRGCQNNISTLINQNN